MEQVRQIFKGKAVKTYNFENRSENKWQADDLMLKGVFRVHTKF